MAMSIPRLKRLKRKTNPYEQRVFISNAGVSTTELTYYVAAHTGGANGLCNEFYAAMKGWGDMSWWQLLRMPIWFLK